MKNVLFIAMFAIAPTLIYAQSEKVDLTTTPNNSGLSKKSNSEYLREATPQKVKEEDLSEKYSGEEIKQTTGTVVQQPNMNTGVGTTAPNSGEPELLKTTTQQQKIGNLNTTTTTQFDDQGKIRGSSTSIKLGGNK